MIATKHKTATPEPEPEEVKIIPKPKKYSLKTRTAIQYVTYCMSHTVCANILVEPYNLNFILKDHDQVIQAAVKQQFEKYQNSNTKCVPERIRKGFK